MAAVPSVTQVPVSQLRKRAHNPNVMEPDKFRLLVESMKKLGFLQPLLVRRYRDSAGNVLFEITDGAHRFDAAMEVGFGVLPCIEWDGTEEQARAIQVAMNRLRGELNLAEVAGVLTDLSDAGWELPDLTLTGFTEEEVTALLKSAAGPSDEEVLENAAPPPDERPAAPRPFALELLFESREQLQKAKRGLKKAAGKGNDLSAGLLRLIEGD